jgi:hypothetical protein
MIDIARLLKPQKWLKLLRGRAKVALISATDHHVLDNGPVS